MNWWLLPAGAAVVMLSLLASASQNNQTSTVNQDNSVLMPAAVRWAEDTGYEELATQVAPPNSPYVALTVPASAIGGFCPTNAVGPRCSLTISASYAIAGSTSFVPGETQQSNEAAPRLQLDPLVSERVVSLLITTKIIDAGAVVASLTEKKSLELTMEDPYVVPIGSSIGEAAATPAADGLRQGCDATDVATCDANADANAGVNFDTTIQTYMRCVGANCAGQTPVPIGAPTDSSYANANINSNGWRP